MIRRNSHKGSLTILPKTPHGLTCKFYSGNALVILPWLSLEILWLLIWISTEILQERLSESFLSFKPQIKVNIA